MEVFTAASLAALIYKVTSVLKYTSAGEFRQVLTQIIPWAAGVIGVCLAAQADVSSGLQVFGDMALSQLDGWSLVLAGVSLGSAASTAYDVKKAVDNTDSAAEPPLSGS